MKRTYQLIAILFASTILFCSSKCNKQKENKEESTEQTINTDSLKNAMNNNTPGLQKLLNSTWRLERFNGETIDHEKYGQEAFILQFTNGVQYAFSLDVNACGGSLKTDNKGTIAFEMPGCTEMCCDSEFAMQVINALHKVEKYRIPELRYLVLLGAENKFEFEAAEE